MSSLLWGRFLTHGLKLKQFSVRINLFKINVGVLLKKIKIDENQMKYLGNHAVLPFK